jgi:hypothetical protein
MHVPRYLPDGELTYIFPVLRPLPCPARIEQQTTEVDLYLSLRKMFRNRKPFQKIFQVRVIEACLVGFTFPWFLESDL